MVTAINKLESTTSYYLTDPQQSLLEQSLERREKQLPQCLAALSDLDARLASCEDDVFSALLDKLEHTQGLFLAMMEEARIDGGLYHSSFHANEMVEDIYAFTFKAQKSVLGACDLQAHFYATLAACMGAAHDLIQNLAPPENELQSEALFLGEINKCFNNALSSLPLSEEDKALLYSLQYALPFIARECLSNGTYLIMGHPTEGLTYPIRDFALVLNYKEKLEKGYCSLPSTLRIMQLALSVCDVRRSELMLVASQRKLLTNLPPVTYPELDELLKTVNLLSKDETIEALLARQSSPRGSARKACAELKLSDIEAFLLRLGQNVRIQVENEHKFQRDNLDRLATAQDNFSLITLLQQKSQEELVTFYGAETTKAINLAFFKTALSGHNYSEAAFAQGLGSAACEVLNSCNDLPSLREFMVREFDANGWSDHKEHLSALASAFKDHTFTEQAQFSKLLFVIAALQPGKGLSPRLKMSMQERLITLMALEKEITDRGLSGLEELLKFSNENPEVSHPTTVAIEEELKFSELCQKPLSERIHSLKTLISPAESNELTTSLHATVP